LILAKKTEEEIQKLLSKTGKSDEDFEAIAAKQVKIVNDIEQELLAQDISRLQRRLDTEELTTQQRVVIIEEMFAIIRTKEQAQAEFVLSLDGKTAEERELIGIKLSNSLEDSEAARVDAVKKANEKILKDDEKTGEERKNTAAKVVQDVADEALKVLSTVNAAKAEALDTDIERLQDSVKKQEEIQEAGGESIIEHEQAQLAKRRLERKRELEQQAQQEQNILLANQFLTSLQAHTKEGGSKGAIGKALKDVFLAKGIVKLLTAFDGIEDTGEGGEGVDNKKGFMAVLHPNERVMSKKQNTKVGNMSNDELADLAYNYQSGQLLMTPQAFKSVEHIGAGSKTESIKPLIEQQTSDLTKAIKANAVAIDVHWNEQGDAIERIVRGNNSVQTEYKNRIPI
jgi:hypothetical protein